MPDSTARIRIRAVGSEQVRAALNGVSRDTQRSARQMAQVRRQIEQDVARSERQKTQVQKRAIAEIEREVRASEQRKRREVERTQREAERQVRRQAQAQERARQRQLGQVGQFASGGVIAGASVAAAGARAFSVGADAARTFAQSGGATGDLGQGIINAADVERRITASAHEAFGGISDELFQARRDAAIRRVAAVGAETGVLPSDLVGGLETAQSTFSETLGFEGALEQLDTLARTSRALNVPVSDLVGVLGEANQQFGTTSANADELFAIMGEQAKAGAITTGQFADNFASIMGQFREFTGLEGIEAFREFGATAQVLRRGGTDPAETATRMRALMTALSEGDTQRKLAARGVFTREFASEEERRRFDRTARRDPRTGLLRVDERTQMPTGRRRRINSIMADLAGAQMTPEQMEQVFGRVEASHAALTLTREHAAIPTLAGVDVAAGQEYIRKGFARQLETQAGQASVLGATSQAMDIAALGARGQEALSAAQIQEGLRQGAPALGAMPDALTSLVAADSPLLGTAGSLPLESFLGVFGPAISALTGDFSDNGGTRGSDVLRMVAGRGLGKSAEESAPGASVLSGLIADTLIPALGLVSQEAGATGTFSLDPSTVIGLNSETTAAIGRSVARNIPEPPAAPDDGGGANRTPGGPIAR